jgi:diguanylate cyclase (GGDEF)-like protein
VTQEVKPAQAVVADRINAQQAQPVAPISTGNSTEVNQQTKPLLSAEPVIGPDEEPAPTPAVKHKPKGVAVLGTVDVDPNASPEDQFRTAANKLLVGRQTPTGPITSDDVENIIARVKASGQSLVVGDPKSKTLTLPQKLLDDIYNERQKSQEQLAEEAKQRAIAPPSEDVLRQQALEALQEERRAGKATNQTDVRFGAEPQGTTPITEDEVQAKIAELQAQEIPEDRRAAMYDVAQKAGAGESGLYGGVGSIIGQAAGLLRPLKDVGIPGYDQLSGLGKEMQSVSGYRNQGQGNQGIGENVAGFLGESVPQLAELVALPGGSVAKFAALGGLSAAGAGKDTADIAKEIVKGAATGKVFDAAGEMESPLARLGTVFGGSAAINAASGEPIDQNLKSSIVNTLFEAQGIYGNKIAGKFFRFWKGGEPLTVGVTPKGEVVIPKREVQAGNDIVLDPDNPVYNREARRATAAVPTTEPEPEKTQYTSQLDEIRQNNAKTTKQVQALFPDANLSREEAADLRRQAWGEEKQDQSSEQVTGNAGSSVKPIQQTATPAGETNGPVAPEINPEEKGFEITGQTGSQPTTAVGKLIEQRNVARREANTDPLTGIANRRALDRALPTAEKDPDTSVISFDANNFGQVNKQLGERAGDRVLVELGNAFKQAAEESNTGARVFRRGGDEFVMLAPKDKAEAIRDRAEQIFGERKYGDTSVSVSGSVGANFDEANAGLQPAKAKRKGATIPPDGIQDSQPARTGNNSGEPPASEQEGRSGSEEETGQAPAETKPPDTGQAEGQPDFFHEGRPAVKLERQGKRIKIQYLDGKKETPWVLSKDLTSAAPDEAPKTAAVKSETIKPSQKVYTERGTEADIETRTIPRDKILTSLDEGYPAELQPRDRSRAASKDQINEISGKLNPELLGDSPKASDGRPLVVPVDIDGETKYAVVSGNGRTEAIRNATGDAAKAYDDFVQSKGGKPGEIYAGVLDPKTDLEKFAREANESSTAKMSASEQAQADAKDLDLANFTPSDDGSIHTGANREFIKRFVGKLPASERGEMMLPDGTLSQTGVNRIRNAVFAKAYGESETGLQVIQRMAESTDNNVKRITSALLQNAPAFADLKESIDQGTRYPGLDITDDITKAVEKFSFLRENGDSVEDYLKQQGLFGEDMTPFQKRLLAVLDTHKNSGKALSGILNNYIRLANAVGDPKQISMFGGTPDENAGTLFAEAVLQYERGNELRPTNQISLLDQDQGREVQPEPGSSGSQDVSATDEGAANQAEDREGSEVPGSSSDTKQAQLKPGDIVSRDGHIGKVYERGGELRVKYLKNDQTVSEPLSNEWTKAVNPEAGSASTDLLTLGLGKTIKDDVVPGAAEAAKVFGDSVDDIRKAVFATGRGETARLGGGELRKNLAEMARSYDVAQHALKIARNYFSKNPIEDNHDFIAHMESGNIGDLPAAEQPFAKELRRLLDEARDRVRALGTGKLESFIENYFPHVWKDPNKATDIFQRIIAGRRPFEGAKSFLKQRKIDTFKEGLDAGLEPLSDNPVDLALLKIREMDRYVAAHKTLNYLKENGLAKFVPIGEKSPEGFIKIDDKIGEVFLPPTMTKPEYVDTTLYEGMSNLAKDLGIKHERLTSAGPGRIGYSVQGGDRIVSQYATGERVLAHEIGHQLDHKYGFIDRFLNNPDKATRAALKKELRDLADSKQATLDNPEGRKTSYTRKRAEQMAHILEGYANDRQAFEKKYPTVNKVFNEIIDENPELKPIRDLQRSLGKTELSTEISRGGITKTGDYYAAEPAARILNNHLSPGLQRRSAFRAWRYAGNVMNQFQLGFSASMRHLRRSTR